MTSPRVALSAAELDSLSADVLVLGAVSGSDGPVLLGDAPAVEEITAQFATFGFGGKADELLRLPTEDPSFGSVAIIGLGADAGTDAVRNAAASAVRQLAGAESLVLDLGINSVADTVAAFEGATLGAYAFNAFRGKTKDAQKPTAASVTILSPTAVPAEALERVDVLADAVNFVKDLTNTPGAELFPASFAAAAERAAEGLPVTVEVWDEARLSEEGCGGILGVGQGSSRLPRLVKVSYNPAGAAKHLAFVGKGITFDTGGNSMKPADFMLTMHHDMAGAATVLAATIAAARLQLNVRVTAWLCIAENLVSSTSIRPNDVLTMRDGTTVEVLNTDAEGRLVMADGLALASEEYPDAIIDVATLTGAVIVALGRRTAAVMGETGLVTSVVEAGQTAGEAHWPMPLPGELRGLLDSRFADLANLNPSVRDGGSLLAGVFLREFVGKTADGSGTIPWAHLDIAGTGTNNGAAYGVTSTGGTGASVRTLVTVLEDFAG
ncbi:leucyl aminopeptidase [Microterricola viridarii]|uniref:Probable cytosol aminopeptidase n=1 Tax=Microterricola viridarii TaxID=412690 RepID=A0A1H1YGE5_9MICO|nr:leucyl aminopeptidase [Microterricola viridarii]SDT20415.1 leucyl aminopeptidase [Microterricola viridarii]